MRIWFVGVDTSGSAAVAAFPGWLEALGVEGRLEPVDLPLGAPDEAYPALVRALRDDDGVAGAVVTSHKSRLFAHAREQLDGVTETARRCREVSVLRWEDGRLVGDAIEPHSVAAALAAMLEPGHWRWTHGEVVLLGAGGTASALLLHLFGSGRGARDAPPRVRLLDVDRPRADALATAVRGWAPRVEVAVYGPGQAGSVLDGLAAGSLVVNASGLGKDRPGSPIPLPACWPRRAVVWDLNYRGELAWLRDAEAAAEDRGLRVHDGWLLFLYGWSEALAAMLGRRPTAAQFDRMRTTAARVRPR